MKAHHHLCGCLTNFIKLGTSLAYITAEYLNLLEASKCQQVQCMWPKQV